jgi:esterase
MLIDNDGVSLYVAEDGDPAAPPLLLLHGITSSTSTWDWLVPDLASRHRVLRLDFRGHGRSGRAPGTYHMPSYVSDAVAVCEQVARRPCIVIGHSLGGGTAAALAQQRPDLVAGVVLEDPALFGAGDQLEGNSLLGVFALMRQSVPMLQEQQVAVDVLAGILGMSPSATGTPFAELLHADALTSTATGLLQLDASVLDPVLERTTTVAFDPLAAIPVPGLLLAADPASSDALVRKRDQDRLAEHSPLVEVRVMSGAGHLIHDELANRAGFAAAVQEFLDAASTRAQT